MDTLVGTLMMILSGTAVYVSIFVVQPNPAAIAVSSLTFVNATLIRRILKLERFLGGSNRDPH